MKTYLQVAVCVVAIASAPGMNGAPKISVKIVKPTSTELFGQCPGS